MFESFREHGVIHTRSHRNTHAHAREGHTKLRIRRYSSKKKKKEGNLGIEKNNPQAS